MQDITELERRITAAMERITRRVETLATEAQNGSGEDGPIGALEEVARLNEALDEERMTNAQLNERLRALRDKEAQAAPAPELQAQLDAQADEIATLRRVLAEAGREIATLRAARASEAAEAAEILAALDPLVSAETTEPPHARA
jgi:chromosome segregation ATPase